MSSASPLDGVWDEQLESFIAVDAVIAAGKALKERLGASEAEGKLSTHPDPTMLWNARWRAVLSDADFWKQEVESRHD